MARYVKSVRVEDGEHCATDILHEHAQEFADMGFQPIFEEHTGESWLLREVEE